MSVTQNRNHITARRLHLHGSFFLRIDANHLSDLRNLQRPVHRIEFIAVVRSQDNLIPNVEPVLQTNHHCTGAILQNNTTNKSGRLEWMAADGFTQGFCERILYS